MCPICAGIPSESEDGRSKTVEALSSLKKNFARHHLVLNRCVERWIVSYQQVLHHFNLFVDVVEDLSAAFRTLLDSLLLCWVLCGISKYELR